MHLQVQLNALRARLRMVEAPVQKDLMRAHQIVFFYSNHSDI